MDITSIDYPTLSLFREINMRDTNLDNLKINSFYNGFEKDSSYVDKVFCDDNKKNQQKLRSL